MAPVSDATLRDAHSLELAMQKKRTEVAKVEKTLHAVENNALHSAIRKVNPDQQNKLDALRRYRASLDGDYIQLNNTFASRGYHRISSNQRQHWRDQNVRLAWQPEITENQRKQALEQADMAEAAYDGGNQTIGQWRWEKTWEHSDRTPRIPKGFRAKLYRDQVTGAIVLAFGGTDDIHDVVTDAQQLLGRRTGQYGYAMKLAVEILKDPKYANGDPAQIEFVGHSLGGLATVASAATKAKATTFNPAGVSQRALAGANQITKLNATLSNAKVTAYRIAGEAVSAQDMPGPLGWILPDTVGTQKKLRLPSTLQHQLKGPLRRHSLKNFKDALTPSL
jgi:hypothetical protein